MKYDLVNQKFGRLTVTKYIGVSPTRHTLWEVKCDCGSKKIIQGYKLVHGHTKSCGCYRIDFPKLTKTKYTLPEKQLLTIWKQMKARCENPNNEYFKDYGGRGICVCDSWKTFDNFYFDMNPKPNNLSLERINNDGNYSPDNVRWASMRDQQNNRRNNRIITLNGISKNITQWSKETGLSVGVIFYRLQRGWSVERSLNEPLKR